MKEYYCQPNCPDRSAVPNCHMTCEKYKNYVEENETRKESKRKEMMKKQGIEKPYLRSINIKRKER